MWYCFALIVGFWIGRINAAKIEQENLEMRDMLFESIEKHSKEKEELLRNIRALNVALGKKK